MKIWQPFHFANYIYLNIQLIDILLTIDILSTIANSFLSIANCHVPLYNT